jgi:hypothetical protein
MDQQLVYVRDYKIDSLIRYAKNFFSARLHPFWDLDLRVDAVLATWTLICHLGHLLLCVGLDFDLLLLASG